jgi:hypothetical protein
MTLAIRVLDEKTYKKPILKKLMDEPMMLPFAQRKKSPGLTSLHVIKSIIEDDGNVKEFMQTNKKMILKLNMSATVKLVKKKIDGDCCI